MKIKFQVELEKFGESWRVRVTDDVSPSEEFIHSANSDTDAARSVAEAVYQTIIMVEAD